MPCDCATALTLTLFIYLFYVFIYLLIYSTSHGWGCSPLHASSSMSAAHPCVTFWEKERKKSAETLQKHRLNVATLKIIFLANVEITEFILFSCSLSHTSSVSLFFVLFFAAETEIFVHLFNASRVFFVSPPLCAPVGDTHRRVLRCVSEYVLLFPFTHSKSLHL